MLLEASSMGADIDMELIPKPDDMDWIKWFMMYPGSAFVITCDSRNTDEVLDLLNSVNITASCIGKVNDSRKLTMKYKDEKRCVFDFNSEIIMGFSEDK